MEINYLTLADHFSLSPEQREERGIGCLALTYSDEAIEAFKISASKVYNIDCDFSSTVFGQLSIIEQVLLAQIPEEEKIPLILSLYYRPIEEKEFDNTKQEIENVSIDFWKKASAGFVLDMFDSFLEARKEFFFKRYNGIIYKERKQKDEFEGDSEPYIETFEDSFYKTFGWYERMRNIAKELNMKITEVEMMPSDSAMIELSYQQNKAKLMDYYEKNKRK